MPISDHVSITVNRRSANVSRAGFGTLLVLGAHRVFDEVIRRYASVSAMETDNFSAHDAEHRAATSYFAQSPRPAAIAIGRRVTGTRVTVEIVTVTNFRTYTVTIENEDISFTSDGTATAAEIGTGLAAAINANIDAVDATTAGAAGVGFFQMNGVNRTALFVDGFRFRITGSTTNDGNYVTRSSSLVGADTRVFVDEVIAAPGVALGNVARVVTATAPSATALGANAFDLNPAVGAPYYRVGGEDQLHVRTTMSQAATTDLNAIRDVDDDWYAAMLTTHLATEIENLTATIEGLRRIFGYASSEAAGRDTTAAADDPTTGSIFARMNGDNLARTWGLWANDGGGAVRAVGADGAADADFARFSVNEVRGDPFPEAAWFGRVLPLDPGAETWKFKSLSTITADVHTATQRTNVLAKNANVYETVGGRDITQDGTVAEPEFIDVIRGIDWLHARLEERLFADLAAADKVAYTDAGIAVIEAGVRSVLNEAVSRGVLAEVIEVSVPAVADTTTADRAARILRSVTFIARLAGAIHEVIVTGEVAP